MRAQARKEQALEWMLRDVARGESSPRRVISGAHRGPRWATPPARTIRGGGEGPRGAPR
jgi:hypothetical protein